MSLNHVQDHIHLIAKHEQEFLAQRPTTERLGDRIANFAGSLPFVGVHLLLFFSWIFWNTLSITSAYHFDPEPSPFLERSLLSKRFCWQASFS
jgi:uncharacterized membrane protein